VAAYTLDGETTIDDEEGDDWLVTHTDIDVAAANKKADADAAAPPAVDDDDCPDLDDFDYGEMGEAAAPAQELDDDMELVATASALRTYDVSIVYDKYYRTPRVFLTGYSADGRLLTTDEVQEDVSADHAHKTVTIETHPYTSLPCLSIHPCQHAHTMKRMLDVMAGEEERMVRAKNDLVKARVEAEKAKKEGDKEVFAHLKGTGVESNVKEEKVLTEDEIRSVAMENVKSKFPANKYLMLFLKFIATVVPTIDYDRTAALELF
jgi:ubiquitin-like-conjugating enzyme ATG3